MKKRILAVLAAFVLVCFAACGSLRGGPTKPPARSGPRVYDTAFRTPLRPTPQNDEKFTIWKVEPKFEYHAFYCPTEEYVAYFSDPDEKWELDLETGEPGKSHGGHGATGFNNPLVYDAKLDLYGLIHETTDAVLPMDIADLKGMCIVRLVEIDTESFDDEDGGYYERWEGSRYAVMYDGELVTGFSYDLAYARGNVAFVYQGEKMGFVSKEGEELTGFVFEGGDPVGKGLIGVCRDGKWDLVDEKGEAQTHYDFEDIITIDEETAFVKKDGKYGILYKNFAALYGDGMPYLDPDSVDQNLPGPVVIFSELPVAGEDDWVRPLERTSPIGEINRAQRRYNREYHLYRNSVFTGEKSQVEYMGIVEGSLQRRGMDYDFGVNLGDTFAGGYVSLAIDADNSLTLPKLTYGSTKDVGEAVISEINAEFGVGVKKVLENLIVDLDGDGREERILTVWDPDSWFSANVLVSSDGEVAAYLQVVQDEITSGVRTPEDYLVPRFWGIIADTDGDGVMEIYIRYACYEGQEMGCVTYDRGKYSGEFIHYATFKA